MDFRSIVKIFEFSLKAKIFIDQNPSILMVPINLNQAGRLELFVMVPQIARAAGACAMADGGRPGARMRDLCAADKGRIGQLVRRGGGCLLAW